MAKSQIQLLTEAVEKLINHPVAPVLPVLPIAPVAPIAPIDNTISNDLIVKFARLEENVKLNFQQVKDAIKELNDGTANRINKLENDKLNIQDSYPLMYKVDVDKAIKDLQTDTKAQGTAITKLWSYGIALIFIVGIVEFIISNFVK